jgi:hypothetical protein
MLTRVGLASVASALLLAGATSSFAQQPDTTSILKAGMRPHTGAVGGQIGESFFVGGGDFSKGAEPRFSFAGSFRYVSTRWGWQLNPYFTWAAYAVNTPLPAGFYDPANPADPDKNYFLTQIAGASGQLMLLRTRGSWTWHLGAGPAAYRVVLENHRKVVKDPVTFDRHRGTYWGATAEIGAEHFLKNLTTTSVEWTFAWQTAFAKKDNLFPSGFSDSPQAIELRVGAHYYYDLSLLKKPGGKTAPAK